MSKPIMARATAVWLVDNTTLTFKQIADFVQMHELFKCTNSKCKALQMVMWPLG